jgi:hypothetical protein
MGRISVVALLVGIVFVVLMSTVLESSSIRIGNLNVLGTVTFLAFSTAMVSGAIALIRDRERSWAVWLSTGLTVLVIGFEVLSLLIPGE